MTYARYHHIVGEIETWTFVWSPLPGCDALHCLAVLLSMFGNNGPTARS